MSVVFSFFMYLLCSEHSVVFNNVDFLASLLSHGLQNLPFTRSFKI